MAKLCMGCMNPLPEGNLVCSVCGFDPEKDQNPEHCLPIATALQGHYIVGRFMGAYSDHLLYLGYDRQLREPCFIQEFFPEGICRRDTIGGVQPLEGRDQAYENYANWFRSNMRSLARLRELPALVPVYDIFEENGTVYAASDYCQGMTLSRKIKMSGGRITWPEMRVLFMPLLSTVAQINEAGIYHGAICPDNIIIGADGRARLWNFSIPAAHQMGGELTPVLNSGFAAPEQYDPERTVGGYTDVYGVAATLFRAVTGNDLPAGNERAKNSDDLFMSAEIAQELSQPVCAALFNALLVPIERRTATMAQLRDQLATTPNVAALVDEAKQDMDGKDAADEKDHRVRNMLIVFGCCLAALLLAAVVFVKFTDVGRDLWKQIRGVGSTSATDDDTVPTGDSTTAPSATTDVDGTTTDFGDEMAKVDDVIGFDYYDLRDSQKLNGRMKLKLGGMRLDDAPKGTILEQSPAPGEMAEKGSEIVVIISMGSENEIVAVPDVAGWKENEAKQLLEAKGFRVEVEKVQSKDQKKGYVVGTDPEAGVEKRQGDTIILLVCDVEITSTTATTTTTTEPTTTTTTEPITESTTTTTTEPITEPTVEPTEQVEEPTETVTDPLTEPTAGEPA